MSPCEALGVQYNTFSVVGRCARTGMLGVAITTSDLAVGSRCPYVTPGVGAVSTQALTEPRLGPKALKLLEGGLSADEAFKKVETEDPHIERRQLGIVSSNGDSAARTGDMNKLWAGHVTARDLVAMGNGLVGEGVVTAMTETFENTKDENLELRLLMAVEAGQQAGGETDDMTPYHSAALLVYADQSFPRVDLRVDDHPDALSELRRIFDLYRPKIDYFSLRATDPEAAIKLNKQTSNTEPGFAG